jgi:repressor LexA
MDTKQTRPTKKQYELLLFIEKFVSQHGYGPSYREIMKGCGYNSVATVALHVNNLISRGHLQKKGRLARSLEVVKPSTTSTKVQTNIINPSEEKWLIEKIDYQFQQLEGSNARTQDDVDKLYVLVAALRVLGLDGAAQSFLARLQTLKKDVY